MKILKIKQEILIGGCIFLCDEASTNTMRGKRRRSPIYVLYYVNLVRD